MKGWVRRLVPGHVHPEALQQLWQSLGDLPAHPACPSRQGGRLGTAHASTLDQWAAQPPPSGRAQRALEALLAASALAPGAQLLPVAAVAAGAARAAALAAAEGE